MDDTESELADAATELAETLEDIRGELQQPPQGPLGIPRPPTPGELLRFTEQYTIPTLIALLETSIRVLELLAATIRIADGRPLDGAGGETLRDLGREGEDRLAAVSRSTLEKLDDALAELQSAAAGGDPGSENPELQRLLGQARELRGEVDARLDEAIEGSSGNALDAQREIDEKSETGEIPEAEDEPIDIDVDAELESIKQDVDEDDDRPED